MSDGSDGPPRAGRDEDHRQPGSFLQLLANAPAPVLEEELRRLEEEHRQHPEALRADYYAVVRVRELVEHRRRRERELASLYATARDLAALRSVDEVLTAIVRRAHTLMATDLAFLQV